jgi:tetratricopeptide (TPR) repeat protein
MRVSNNRQAKHNQNLKLCRDELTAARESGDQRRICTASASLGLALFQSFKTPEGLKCFNEAQRIAKELDNLKLQVHCLGMKALAYQAVGRYPDAFRIAEEVLSLGEAHNDEGLRLDAYASMGQVLLESGEPVLALEKFNEAQNISATLDDPRRAMNIRNAMGNYSLNIGSPDRAFEYFEDAMEIAVSLGDKKTEIGLLGNLGTILSWKNQHQEAVQAFEQVLSHVREQGNKEIEGQTLRHLVNSHDQLEEYEKVLRFGQAGLALQDWTDAKTTIFFYEKIISVYYRRNEMQEAEAFTLQAIEFSRACGDKSKEVDFLLSLGESYVLSDQFEKAFEIYTDAAQKATALNRIKDAAYLIGRMGFALAELGRLDEAIPYHKEALRQARTLELPELAGEQLSMLALAYQDKQKFDEASTYCRKAIQVFSSAGFEQQAQNTQQLLAEIALAKQT